MPDDIAQWAQLRGAQPVTIRFRPDGANTTQRHATWRLPDDHPDACRLEQLYSGRHIDARQYANACAAMRLYHDSGLGRSEGVATWLRTCRTSGDGDIDHATAKDILNGLIRSGGVEFQAVLMLVRGDVLLPYMWSRCLAGLDRLDWLPGRYDGEQWRAE